MMQNEGQAHRKGAVILMRRGWQFHLPGRPLVRYPKI